LGGADEHAASAARARIAILCIGFGGFSAF